MEVEQQGKLPFLDGLVCRSNDSTITTKVYWKPTDDDRYLNYSSNHHPKIKARIIQCLAHRAKKVWTPCHLQAELQHLETVFLNNGYRSLSNFRGQNIFAGRLMREN